MRRREFITLLGGTAAAWPLAARAQQGDRVRRIGVLMPLDENDPERKTFVSAFTQALADLGWTDGRNVRMDLRWGGGDVTRSRRSLPSSRKRGRSRSSLRAGPTPSPAASSRGSTAPVRTSPASPLRKPRWEASGLSCSRRLRLGSSGPQSCSIPTRSPHRLIICPQLRRRPGRSRSSQSLRSFIAT